MCGALLLSLGVLDDRPDFSWIDPDFADVAASAGQFVPSLIGAALMVLAVGLSQRVTLAWGATIALLLLAAGYTAAQGDSLWISAVLVLSAVLVAPFRDAFYRHARLLTGTLQADVLVPLTALAVCVFALAAFEPQVRRLSENSWWEIVLSPDLPNSLRMVMALAVLLALLAIWRLLRPGHVTWLPWAGEGRLRYASLGADPPVRADGVVLGEAGRSGIPFRRLGGVMLGLGDPAGAPSDRISAIWRLRDLAAQEGMDPAVWRAGPALLKVYGDLGLTALPLGADGSCCRKARTRRRRPHYLCCVAERDLTSSAAPPTLAARGWITRPSEAAYRRSSTASLRRTSTCSSSLHRLPVLVRVLVLATIRPRSGLDRDGRSSSTSLTACNSSPGRTGADQVMSLIRTPRPRPLTPPSDAFQQQPHGERGRVPAAGGQAAEHGAAGGLLVHVLRLEVELRGEGLDRRSHRGCGGGGEHLPYAELLETGYRHDMRFPAGLRGCT